MTFQINAYTSYRQCRLIHLPKVKWLCFRLLFHNKPHAFELLWYHYILKNRHSIGMQTMKAHTTIKKIFNMISIQWWMNALEHILRRTRCNFHSWTVEVFLSEMARKYLWDFRSSQVTPRPISGWKEKSKKTSGNRQNRNISSTWRTNDLIFCVCSSFLNTQLLYS